MPITPLFLLSLPRSGSTLLQRALSRHPEISTVTEPWIALPLLNLKNPHTANAHYSHYFAAQALLDLCDNVPGSERALNNSTRSFLLDFYTELSSGSSKYFLDKTPRYALVANELFHLFPDARFLFLWRNPLAVAASMMTTYARGRWNLHLFHRDLYFGARNLIELCRGLYPHPFAYSIRYEDLVTRPQVLQQTLRWLGLSPIPEDTELPLALRGGQLGDSRGVSVYGSDFSTNSLQQWPLLFRNPLRRKWARTYLSSFSDDDLTLMGYSRSQIREELHSTRPSLRYLLSDSVRMPIGRIRDARRLRSLRGYN